MINSIWNFYCGKIKGGFSESGILMLPFPDIGDNEQPLAICNLSPHPFKTHCRFPVAQGISPANTGKREGGPL